MILNIVYDIVYLLLVHILCHFVIIFEFSSSETH